MGVTISKRRNRIKVHDWDGYQVLDLGQIEIWDGADLALLRDMMIELIENGATKIGVEMQAVKYIPSGFFGMLFDWLERGIGVRLYHPQPNVSEMLWFRQFFYHLSDGTFVMSEDVEADQAALVASKAQSTPAATRLARQKSSWAADTATALATARVTVVRH